MLPSRLNAILLAWRGRLMDEPSRWGEAELRAKILRLEKELAKVAEIGDARQASFDRVVAEANAVLKENVQFKVDLATSRKATDALEAKLRATLADMHEVEEQRDLFRSALEGVEQVVGKTLGVERGSR